MGGRYLALEDKLYPVVLNILGWTSGHCVGTARDGPSLAAGGSAELLTYLCEEGNGGQILPVAVIGDLSASYSASSALPHSLGAYPVSSTRTLSPDLSYMRAMEGD